MGKTIENVGQFTRQEAKRYLLERMQAVEPVSVEEADFLGSEITGGQKFEEKQAAVISKSSRRLGMAFAADVRDSNDFRMIRAQYRAAVALLLPSDVLFHAAHQSRLTEEQQRSSEHRRSRNRFILVTTLALLLATWFVFAVTSGRLIFFR